MLGNAKKPLIICIVFSLITVVSAAIPELGGSYFSGYDGLGRGVMLVLFVTIPAGIIAFWFLISFIAAMYKSKHLK
jgi:hypothetical protein